MYCKLIELAVVDDLQLSSESKAIKWHSVKGYNLQN